MVFNLILCKLYSNSLVSNLNSRGGWKYNTAATPESESIEVNGESNPTRIAFAAIQASTEKVQILLLY
jgi:hypothetical protein